MLRVRIGGEALLRCRFALSPLMETMLALRALGDPTMRRYHLPWLDSADRELRGVDLEPLRALSPLTGWTPDFLTPPPERIHPDIGNELARVRATPAEQVEHEIRRSFAERTTADVPDAAWRLLDDPTSTRDRLADSLEACWKRVMEPHWPRLEALLDADVQHRTKVLAQGGLARVLDGLDPRLSYRDGELRMEQPTDARHDLHGDGLLLIPSAFTWPYMIWVIDEPWQPALVYPARGVAELWQPRSSGPRSEALARLLGTTRSTLLESLVEEASTRTLARRHELAPATVSEHLTTLTAAGLTTRRRHGAEVLYALTDLGIELARVGP